MHVLSELELTRGSGRVTKSGTTLSGEPSVASAVEWELHLPGRPTLRIHDNHWRNGERDLVVHKPPVMPEMPSALSNLHGRLRSGIAPTPGRRELRVMVYPTYVDQHGRPRINKSLTTEALADRMGLFVLRELTDREGVTLEPAHDRPDLPLVDLDDPQDEKPLQHALFFPAEDDETPVLGFVHFRVLPVLRHIDWLASDGG
ncbi:hypothetical protein [Streptomyces prasinus]|uniref:hypothetical protein n=1 Tax=Streptomyces prasinus TaxID=67345 RepID=UPI0006EB8FB8|nr:hypothetical protein [Streptomyces prasinus]